MGETTDVTCAAALDAAVAAGKIPAGRRGHWAGLWARDPVGTAAMLGSMCPGVIPRTGDVAERISRVFVGVTDEVMAEARASLLRAGRVGGDRLPVVFRLWRGPVVHMADPRWWGLDRPRVTTVGAHLDIEVRAGHAVVTVWCGPDAPYPAVPTPDDLLHAAGMDWAVSHG